jgi:hypothetical protein
MRLTIKIYLIFVTAFGLGCSAVGDVPTALRVDSGIDPAMQDEYVRFRTTYYFRIVDSCRVEDGFSLGTTTGPLENDPQDYDKRLGIFRVRKKGKIKIVNDSLYRFRMTGKASALFNSVRFESGVLRAEQIDPFGSAVVYDDKTRSFRVESAGSLRQNASRKAVYAEIKALKDLYNEFENSRKHFPGIQQEIAQLIKNAVLSLGNGEPQSTLSSIDDESKTDRQVSSLQCPDGRPARRSYLLYGPEGVREIDPDERLLMAMSSDSKPIVSTLQQLSHRQIKSDTNNVPFLSDFLAERLWISDIKTELDRAKYELSTINDLQSPNGIDEPLRPILEKLSKNNQATK